MKKRTKKPRIEKIIIVEGRNDESAVKAVVDAEVIVTGGFLIDKSTWELMEKAYEGPGILIFTDPDYMGEKIRRRINHRFPKSTHAHISRDDGKKNSDIGIENASGENIIIALNKAIIPNADKKDVFTMDDLLYFDLNGTLRASAKREKIGKVLGIGSCNSKTFLARLNSYRISREEFYRHGQALFSDRGEGNNKQT